MRPGVFISAVCVLCCGVFTSNASAVTLDDVQFWVGSGANRTGFVLDWNDGRRPLLWGYLWDGVATAEQMVRDIVTADERLYAKAAIFNFGGPDVLFITGIGYDRDGDGFAITDGTSFDPGITILPPSDGATATDPHDSYREGLNTGFWAYYLATGNPYVAGLWEEVQTGISETLLVDEGFQGIRFAPGFASAPPTTEPVPAAAPAVATPEPGTIVMLLCGGVGMCLRRRPA